METLPKWVDIQTAMEFAKEYKKIIVDYPWDEAGKKCWLKSISLVKNGNLGLYCVWLESVPIWGKDGDPTYLEYMSASTPQFVDDWSFRIIVGDRKYAGHFNTSPPDYYYDSSILVWKSDVLE